MSNIAQNRQRERREKVRYARARIEHRDGFFMGLRPNSDSLTYAYIGSLSRLSRGYIVVELERKLQFLLDKRERVGLSRTSPAYPVFWLWEILFAKRGNLIFGGEGGSFGCSRLSAAVE